MSTLDRSAIRAAVHLTSAGWEPYEAEWRKVAGDRLFYQVLSEYVLWVEAQDSRRKTRGWTYAELVRRSGGRKVIGGYGKHNLSSCGWNPPGVEDRHRKWPPIIGSIAGMERYLLTLDGEVFTTPFVSSARGIEDHHKSREEVLTALSGDIRWCYLSPESREAMRAPKILDALICRCKNCNRRPSLPEEHLYIMMRYDGIEGRREQPLKVVDRFGVPHRYTVDWLADNEVYEADGSQHLQPVNAAADAVRDENLMSIGKHTTRYSDKHLAAFVRGIQTERRGRACVLWCHAYCEALRAGKDDAEARLAGDIAEVGE